MEPVTHMLTGACLSRSGFNRRAAYATRAMVIGAEFPDIDTVWGLRGPVEGFVHHRGITHTFLGLPFEAALITAAVYGFHRWRVRRGRAETAAPLRWGWLFVFTLLALLSHLWLDYGNNYGLRPFFPFNPHWYAASTVFIFDPLLFVVLLLALVLPSLLRLIHDEVGARSGPFRGRSLARAALIFMVVFYAGRAYEHAQAESLGMAQSIAAPSSVPAMSVPILPAQRVLMSPDPLSPFRWYGVTDFGPAYQLSIADTRRGRIDASDGLEAKANTAEPVLQAAQASTLGRAYMDWSPMPFLTVLRPDAGDADRTSVVLFRDPRFMGNTPLLHTSDRVPLTGTVEIGPSLQVVSESLDGRMEPESRLHALQ